MFELVCSLKEPMDTGTVVLAIYLVLVLVAWIANPVRLSRSALRTDLADAIRRATTCHWQAPIYLLSLPLLLIFLVPLAFPGEVIAAAALVHIAFGLVCG